MRIEQIRAHANNYTVGRGGQRVTDLIIHHIAGTKAGAIARFLDGRDRQRASAHYVLAKDRSVTQMVDLADTAHHAGAWDVNQRSVGIEHELGNTEQPTDRMIEDSVTLALETSEELKRRGLGEILFDRQHVLGHNQVHPTACPAWTAETWERWWKALAAARAPVVTPAARQVKEIAVSGYIAERMAFDDVPDPLTPGTVEKCLFVEGQDAMAFVTLYNSGRQTRTVCLYYEDGSEHSGHAGGIVVAARARVSVPIDHTPPGYHGIITLVGDGPFHAWVGEAYTPVVKVTVV